VPSEAPATPDAHALSHALSHAGIAALVAATLERLGADASELFRTEGIDLESLQVATTRVDARAMQQVWRRAVEVTGDESFGLRVAERLQPATFQGLGFACLASATLRDALERLARHQRLIASHGELELSDAGAETVLEYVVPRRGAAAPASLDAALGVFLQLCRITAGASTGLLRVDLQRPRPEDARAFEAFFEVPVSFDGPRNLLHFRREALDAPLPLANPELARANDEVVIRYLARFADGDVIARVRACLIEMLPDGTPSQNAVADTLHMSTRSLQRRLADADTNFRALLEELRAELARRYLEEGSRSIGEITYLLGFTEPSNRLHGAEQLHALLPTLDRYDAPGLAAAAALPGRRAGRGQLTE
jgi:AraC-like DNA-binding protein